jgi:hypothetical protein
MEESMTKKSPGVELLLTIITLGIYGIFWLARTRGELVARGAQIPTTWLIIIPFVNLYYYWKYSAGGQQVTGGNLNGVLLFILFILLFPVAVLYAQMQYNKVD